MTELIITRTFNASREKVWKAFTDPRQVIRWWGPKHFTAPFVRITFGVGGKYLYCMRSPEGKDYWSTGIYKEIIKPKLIIATDSFSDSKGKIVPASYYGMKGMPLELDVAIMFEEKNGKTLFTLKHTGFSKEMAKDAKKGWNQSFDKLDMILK